MKRTHILGAALAATGIIFLAGCATTPAAPGQLSKAARARLAEEDLAAQVDMEERAQSLAHFAAGVLDDLEERPQDALEHFALSAQSAPANDGLIEDVCRRYLLNKQPEKALEMLEKAAADPEASAGVHAWRGFVLGQLGRTNEAAAASRLALKKDPKLFFAYQNLYQYYALAKDSKEVNKLLDQAAKQPGAGPDFLVQIAQLWLSYRQLHPEQAAPIKDKIVALLDRALEGNSENVLVAQRIADLHAAVKSAKAETIYKDLLERIPALPGLREKLLMLYAGNGQEQKATEQMEIIAKNSAGNAQTLFYLGTIAQQTRKFKEAVDYYTQVLALKPDLEQVYYELATVNISAEKPEDAVHILNRARTRFGPSFAGEFYSGLALARMKKYGDALKRYDDAESLARTNNPKFLTAVFYFQRGAALERSGNPTEAEKSFQKSLEIEPDFSEALNYLGYMWAEKGIKLPEAKVMIEKALKLEPDSGAILDSMGWVLFKLGQPKDALGYLLKSVQKNEEADGTIYDHLGDVYAALKQFDKAREAWEKSLKAEPSEAIQQKLKSLPTPRKP